MYERRHPSAGRAGDSPTSLSRRPFVSSSTTTRASAASHRRSISSCQSSDSGSDRHRRTAPMAARSDDGRARGAYPPPEGKSDVAGKARDSQRGGCLLRDRAAVTFHFIAAAKAHHSLTLLCRCLQVTRSGSGACGSRVRRADHGECADSSSVPCSHEDGLKARVRKQFKGTTMSDHDQPVAANLLAPN